MYGIALTFTLLAAVFFLSVTGSTQMAAQAHAQNVQFLAENVSVYTGFAKRYVTANPGFTGAVSDAAAGLPSWYGKQEGMSLYVASGKAYVYLRNVEQDDLYQAADYIRERTKLASWGIKQAGKITTADGVTVIIPTQVPDGSFVYVL